jgi:predicted AAA+ superfamily ATPase
MNSKRTIYTSVSKYLKKYPIVVITGPRQSGKTTFLKQQFSEYRYVNLENPDTRSFAETDPNGFLKIYDKYVIFDEVQRVPSLFSYIQSIVDDSNIRGQFILSGSQNFHLMQRITQSLAGRVAIFKLLPFDFSELKAAGWFTDKYLELILKGAYPAIYDREIPSKVFYSNYIQTYIERDITELVNVHDSKQFRNFLGLCATRAGQLLNLNALANSCGISQPTAKAWLSVLESSYIVFLLQPYYNNFSKRIVKSPKLYFYDTGLLTHLLKIKSVKQDQKGMLFENLIISEYYKKNQHLHLDLDLWFWRDSAGHEVDLLVQNDEMLNAIEIKCTETVLPKSFEGLDYFNRLAQKEVKSNTLIYAGLESQQRSFAIVLSWNDLYEPIGELPK